MTAADNAAVDNAALDVERGSAVSPGWIVVLNGPPRSGKSSIVDVIQETFDGPWLNLGVDVFSQHVTPPRLRPGIGLRPGGGERPDIEKLIPALYAAFYDSVAAHSRHGLNVVVDAGHHDAYSVPMNVLPDAARRRGTRAGTALAARGSPAGNLRP